MTDAMLLQNGAYLAHLVPNAGELNRIIVHGHLVEVFGSAAIVGVQLLQDSGQEGAPEQTAIPILREPIVGQPSDHDPRV